MPNPFSVVSGADPGRELASVDDDGNWQIDGTLTVDGSGIVVGSLTVGGSLLVGGQAVTPGGGGAGGGGVALTPVSGRYSILPGFGRAGGSNLALGVGDMVGVAFEVAAAATFDRIGTDVAIAGGAGGLLRAELYQAVSATDTRPGALVADYGTIPSDDGTGAHLWTVAQDVVPGTVYVAAIAAQVAGCTVRTTETYDPRVTVSGTAGWTGTVANGAYVRTGVTGAPPDPFGVPLDEVPIRIALRWV